jgi:hypothetical protein
MPGTMLSTLNASPHLVHKITHRLGVIPPILQMRKLGCRKMGNLLNVAKVVSDLEFILRF